MQFSKEALLEEMKYQDEREASKRSSKSVLEEVLESISGQDDTTDILTYIRSSWGLEERPYPIQQFILKLIYGLPLDDKPNEIKIWDRFREHITGSFSEKKFLEFLYKEDRCNISPEEHQRRQGQIKTSVILRFGRRGTKTTLSQWISAYTIYKLLKHRSPQEYYRIRQDQPIRVTLVATGREQAQDLLAPARSSIKRSPYLSRFVENDSAQRISLLTQRNKELGLGAESGLLVTSAPCSARSVRGPANILVLLEEFGAFYWELSGSNKSDLQIYRALSPSTGDFRNPVTGKAEGMMIVISTPLSRESHMYTLEMAIREGSLPGLILHLPSYWINPLLAPEKLKADYAVDKLGFLQEYDAEYLDQAESAFTRDQMEACRQNISGSAAAIDREEVTFMGVDLGLKNDGTTITIAAANPQGVCRIVHHEQHRVGLPGYEDVSELDIEDMAKRIDHLWDYYSCKTGIADQWNSFGLKSYLQSAARHNLEFTDFNQTSNDRVARETIAMIAQKRVIFYLEANWWEDRECLLKEFCRLQRMQTGGDPPKIKIRAPNIRGFHDDQYSSVSRALWAAKLGIESRGAASSHTVGGRGRGTNSAARERAEVLRRQKQTGRVPQNPWRR